MITWRCIEGGLFLYNMPKKYIPKKKSLTHRKCRCCNDILPNENFTKRRNGFLGLDTICKICSREKAKKKYYRNKELGKLKSKPKITITSKVCKKCDIEKDITEFKSQQAWVCSDCRNKTVRECQIRYKSKNRLKVAVRNIVYQSFVRACEGTYIKSKATEDILGCSMNFFRKYIESSFQEGMSWDNYGKINETQSKVWHIDHKIPLSSAKGKEDIIRLCHYTNLQPLWALDNIKKSDKICVGSI